MSVSFYPRQGRQTAKTQIYCLPLFRSVQTPFWQQFTQVEGQYLHLLNAGRVADSEQIVSAHEETVACIAAIGVLVVVGLTIGHVCHLTFAKKPSVIVGEGYIRIAVRPVACIYAP